MSDPYSLDFDSLAFRMRLDFGLAAAPARRTVPASKLENAMEEYWLAMAHKLGRMPYHEAPGFASEPSRYVRSLGLTIKGYEAAYGIASRSHWKYIWLAMKCGWRAAMADARGDLREEVVGGNRTVALMTGLTA